MKVFKRTGRDGKKLRHWYGKIKTGGKWSSAKKLFTDKVASQRRLDEMQREADQREAGVRTTAMDQAFRPIGDHVKDYVAAKTAEKLGAETLRLLKWQIDRLVDLGQWKRISDVTAESMRGVLAKLEAKGNTAAHQNTFIKRAKAFVHWLQQEGRIAHDPLASLKRVNEKRSKRTRARRALTDDEVVRLIGAAPEDRRLKYALAILAGMRRSELANVKTGHGLVWGDIHVNAPQPFIKLREELTKNGKVGFLPLHPYLVELLQQPGPAMPNVRVVKTVPDIKTVLKDLKAAGVAFTDESGRRADFHALRHTFCTNLERAGCSVTTKRALMRHSDEGVTEGYSHARISELYEAIQKLPNPKPRPATEAAARTGTDDRPVSESGDPLNHQLHQGSTSVGQEAAATGSPEEAGSPAIKWPQPAKSQQFGRDRQCAASADLIEAPTRDIVLKARPSTQVV